MLKILSMALALAMMASPAISVRHEHLYTRFDGVEQSIHIVRFDPRNPFFDLETVISHDMVYGFETVADMARRRDAVAAVNGGFFYDYGRPVGFFARGGEIITLPEGELPVFGVNKAGDVFFDRLNAHVNVETQKGIIRLDGMNRPPKPGEAIAYTPPYSLTTRYAKNALNVVVNGGNITGVLRKPLVIIPRDGFVVLDTGSRRTAGLSPGGRAALRVETNPVFDFCCALQTGPWLVRDGQVVVRPWEPLIGVTNIHAPRTAIGIDRKGRILLVTVDGRQPHAQGMTLEGLARWLLKKGAVNAAALDGGASTTMVLRGEVINNPSMGRERHVGGGVMVVSRISESQFATFPGKYENHVK